MNKQAKALPSKAQFGTFQGVFLPSILTIFGVIMYLRMGWVLGNVGITGTIIIVTLATAITFITGLSISSIATNMKVKTGGAYFMISRSLGAEAGAAIGLSLYFAKAVGVAFYIAGFTESVCALYPDVSPYVVSIGSLILITTLAFISANVALKASIVIFIIVIASLISFFAGGTPADGFKEVEVSLQAVSFWMVFAVFFPAVTGIEAGISMSGDLKNPAKSLPWGTLAAVVLGFLVYLAIPIYMNSFVPRDVLLSDRSIFANVSRVPVLVILGIWGATLSSALGSLLGAPRNLQALARDRIVPTFLGKGHGDADTPRIATALTFIIAAFALAIGNLNSIAPVLTMFFLTTYGSLNLVAGLDTLINNPSWRPMVRTPAFISLIGAFMCLAAMLMINAGATFIAIFVVAALYYITAKRGLTRRWLDMRRSVYLALARFAVFRLSKSVQDTRSWRPNILVLAGSVEKRLYLIEIADAITHGKGFLTVASVLSSPSITQDKIISLENSIRDYLDNRKIPALVEVIVEDNLAEGVKTLVKTYGLGPLIPNTIVLGESEDPEKHVQFSRIIKTIYESKRNIVIIRESQVPLRPPHDDRKIYCWWGGKRHNAGLMLTLGYMLQTSPEWRGAAFTIKTIVRKEDEVETTTAELNDYLKGARVLAQPEVILHEYDESPLPTTIRERSADADFVFIGLRPPEEDEPPEEYARYYEDLLKKTEGFPILAIVLAAEDIKFQEIFV